MKEYPPAVEDYVKVIYAHTEWQPEPITTSALAARLGLAASSVTEMTKKLVALGLVEHERYGAITLTNDGTVLALRMVRRHRLIETWLVESFDYSWDEVHVEAEVLEHALSDRLLEAIDDQLGHPVRDPHGDPIPTGFGHVHRPVAVLLRDAEPGTVGRVVRISDSDPRLLRHLAAEAITLDRELRVVGRTPYGGSFSVQVHGEEGERDLGEQALASIWIAVELPAP
jgi:DtxR family transcriptional regulator, Mn-dependent transcriptional regulator